MIDVFCLKGVKMTKKGVSIRGWFVRELIRRFVSLVKVNGFFMLGHNFSKSNRLFKVPRDYKNTKFMIDDINVELLEKKNPNSNRIIIHFHGGAYIIGFLSIYRYIALKYSKVSGGAKVLSIDYKIAPKHHYPSALIDAFKVYGWCINHGYKSEDIIFAGDSAGGNLAVSLTMKLRDEGRPLPQALILMSPWLDLAANGESYLYNLYKDPIFGFSTDESIKNALETKILVSSYMSGANAYDPYVSPIYGKFHGFPKMLIQVGTYEMLESDADTLYEKATKAGVNAKLTKYEGMFHSFQLFGSSLKESKQAWEEVELFFKELE